MKLRIFFVLLCLMGSLPIYGQVQLTQDQYKAYERIPQETIKAHLNSDFLLTGETVLYKLYCFVENTSALSDMSKFAYVELIDSNQKSVLKQKVQLNNGLGQGDVFIASEMPSGVYKFIAYTRWMKNQNLFVQQNIRIVNPFESNIDLDTLSAKQHPTKAQEYFALDKLSYENRDQVTLSYQKLQEEFEGGQFSLSVRMKNPSEVEWQEEKRNRKPLDGNRVFLPEFRGELISGTVTSKDKNTAVENLQVALSIVQENGISKITRVNAQGDFHFVLDANYQGETAFLEVLDKGDFSIAIKQEPALDLSQLSFPKLSLDSLTLARIKKRAIYMQVENAFAETKQDRIETTKSETPIFWQGAITFRLDDFKRFKTVQETFIEIIDIASVERSQGTLYFKAKKPDFGTSDPRALVIVDGYIISDHQEALDINPKQLRQIHVLKKSYKLSSRVYQGVIYLETFKGDYEPKSQPDVLSLKLTKPTATKTYFAPDYEQENPNRIPDYRTQLLWLPSFDLLSSQTAFYTSDISGVFEIVLEGVTKNGEYISVKQVFEVE
jgi:hypothetical protein